MSFELFYRRIAELDAVLDAVAERGRFCAYVIRDTSNRSGRDWPWWSVDVEDTEVDGTESRRATAIVTLDSTQDGKPGGFHGTWRAQIWHGVSPDTFRQEGRHVLDWTEATPEVLEQAITRLLDEARAALPSSTS